MVLNILKGDDVPDKKRTVTLVAVQSFVPEPAWQKQDGYMQYCYVL